VLMFFLLIGVVFWISSLHDRPDFRRREGSDEVSSEFAVTNPHKHGRIQPS
jgi:hypothetical protein